MTDPASTRPPEPLAPHQIHALARTAAAGLAPGTKAVPVHTPHGPAIVKLHRDIQRWRNEVTAYRTWVPAVQANAPVLLGTDADPPALVLTLARGPRLDRAELDPHREQGIFHALGAFLKVFHSSAPPRPEPTFTSWLGERGLQWLDLAQDLLDTRERDAVRDHLQALAALPVTDTVPCHLDFTLSNVIITATGPAVIDYEHTRYDLAIRDLTRLHDRVWPRRPDLRDSFLDAYGAPNATDQELLTHTVVLDRLTQRVRAHQRHLPTPGPDREMGVGE